MRTFITWSGHLSHGVALELKQLLRLVFPTVDVFVSSEDIRKGQQWRAAVTEALAQSQRGIICLTPENYNQPWVLFEAGVLTRALQRPVVYTVLIDDLEPSTLEGHPLSQFQHTRLEHTDMRRLLKQINLEIGEGRRTDAELDNIFGKTWPDMVTAISELVLTSPKKVIRITDLARESPIIAGKVFRNAVIQGPAVLAILEGNAFTTCRFESPSIPEAILWTPLNPDATIGAIGLSRCRFENCEFIGIGLTGGPEVIAQIRKVAAAQQQQSSDGSRKIQIGSDVNTTLGGRSDFFELQKAKREAATKFRSAFAEAVTQITDGSIDPHSLIAQQKVQHDAAIFEFRHFVDPDRLSDFDAAGQKYRECRSALEPALLQFMRSQNTGQPVGQSASSKIIVAINELLAFADNPSAT